MPTSIKKLLILSYIQSEVAPHSSEYTLEVNDDAERLRMQVLLSQPPQCDSSSRRSPAVGTGLGEPEVPRTETQLTEREGMFLFKPVSTVAPAWTRRVPPFCFMQTSGWTTTKQQLSKQQRVTAWGKDLTKQFDPGG